MKYSKIFLPFLSFFTILTAIPSIARDAPAHRTITANSAGLIKLGGTVADARKLMKSATFSRGVDSGGPIIVNVREDRTQLMFLKLGEEDADAPIDENRAIVSIHVQQADFKTAEGVHAGILVRDAERIYGKIIQIEQVLSHGNVQYEHAEFANQPTGLDFILTGKGGEAGRYKNSNRTTRYKQGATISQIIVAGRDIYEEGAIGAFKPDSTEAEALAAAKAAKLGPVSKGADKIDEERGAAVQTWTFGDSGISLIMISGEVGRPKTVSSIAIESPSKLKTPQGIGIGSAKADVVQAYAEFAADKESKGLFDGQDICLIGNDIYGMVYWFEEGKVSRIVFGLSPHLVAGGAAQAPAAGSITANSVGSIRIGMTVAEARKAMKSAKFSRGSDGEGIALIDVRKGDVHLMTLYAGEEDSAAPIDDDGVVEIIDVWNAGFMTGDGVHTGMLLSEAEKAYGKVREIQLSEIESREYAEFTRQPVGVDFLLRGKDGMAGIYRDGEMRTGRYTPSARIFSIGITGAEIMRDSSIGGIRIDATEAEVIAIAKAGQLGKYSKGKEVIWEAFGMAAQPWTFSDAGLSLDMLSEKIGGSKTVFSITLEKPSKLKTGQGIGIGSAKADVIKAYADFPTDPEESKGFFGDRDVHLVGSIYGGMIFSFETGKVARIFLGPSAE